MLMSTLSVKLNKAYSDQTVAIIVKLRYNVLLGTGKNSTLYPGYVVTIKATNRHL